MHMLTRNGFQSASAWCCSSLGGDGSPWAGPAPVTRLRTSVSGRVLRENRDGHGYSLEGKQCLRRYCYSWNSTKKRAMCKESLAMGTLACSPLGTPTISPRDPGGLHSDGGG